MRSETARAQGCSRVSYASQERAWRRIWPRVHAAGAACRERMPSARMPLARARARARGGWPTPRPEGRPARPEPLWTDRAPTDRRGAPARCPKGGHRPAGQVGEGEGREREREAPRARAVVPRCRPRRAAGSTPRRRRSPGEARRTEASEGLGFRFGICYAPKCTQQMRRPSCPVLFRVNPNAINVSHVVTNIGFRPILTLQGGGQAREARLSAGGGGRPHSAPARRGA